MFSEINEKRQFLNQNNDKFIPGYTGHCPTLKFHYGQCYGTITKEILRELREKKVYENTKRGKYRALDYQKSVLAPICREKGQSHDYALDYRNKAPRYITGYTGFVPTLSSRYGKSYGIAADDSIHEYEARKYRKVEAAEDEINRMYMFRAQSAPKFTTPIRDNQEVHQKLDEYRNRHRFKERKISPEDPPIAGYTGHIPGVKGNENSLSNRYSTVVKNGLTRLRQEREKFNEMKNGQNKVVDILQEYEKLHQPPN